MAFAESWNNLSDHFDLHDEEMKKLDFASAANRLIAWPAMMELAGACTTGIRRRAVDFGCGTGGLCRMLDRAGFSVHGIDQSPKMIEIAREKTPARIGYSVGSDDALKNFSGADLLTCSLVLNYVPELEPFVASAERLLSEGGLLVTADLNRPYVAGCLRAGLFYEQFDSMDEPRLGLLDFGNDITVPLTIRSEDEYDELLLPRGWSKAGSSYSEWPSIYIESFASELPEGLPLHVPKYQVLAYRRG